jgi:OPA family sugar phosphate sensor protein UhpC-like MFS transporter
MMSAGLIITGLLSIFFGFSSSLAFFVVFTFLNGLFQGFGWPPCARYLTHWYSHNERGTWWSCWNISHNLGGALIPIIVAMVTLTLGWRYGLFIPGVICIGAGLLLLNRLRDTPQSLGLPSIEEWRDDYAGEERVKSSEEKEISTRDGLVNHVLKNPFIWLLAFAYLFIYVTREAFNYWTQLFLIQEKSYDALTASYAILFFEGGGVVGSLFAGWFSDRYTNGRRGPVNVIYSAALLGATALFWFVPNGYAFLDYLSVSLIGFCVFGPQMLIGLAAAEIAHKKAAATATGFLGLVAYLGAALSGYPLGKITDHWGWEGFFITAGACCICSTLLLIPTWSVTAGKPKKLESEAA